MTLPPVGGATQAVARLADNPWARAGAPTSIIGLLIYFLVLLQGLQGDINDLQIWKATHSGEHKAAGAMYERELDHWRATRDQTFKSHGYEPPGPVTPP